MALTHLLDTSAWLAHVFDEPGAEAITALLEDDETELGISVLSIVEGYGRFRSRERESEFDEMLDIYRQLFSRILPVSEAIALQAIALSKAASARVPAVDCLIAATAAHHDAILVHCDRHFSALPATQVKQRYLADSDSIQWNLRYNSDHGHASHSEPAGRNLSPGEAPGTVDAP